MSRRTRVLFALPSLAGGGAERVMVTLMRHLDRERFVVALAIGHKDGPFVADLPEDVRVHELGSTRARGAVFSLAGVVRAEKPDVVFPTLGMAVAAAAARPWFPTNTRLVTRLGNTPSSFLDEVGSRGPGHKLAYAAALRLSMTAADRVIVQSDYMAQDVQDTLGVPPSRVIRIHNPVDTIRIEELARLNEPKFASSGVHLFTAGRLTHQKGYDVLIPAFATATASLPDIHLHIGGTGEELDSLVRLAESSGVAERTHFHGFVDNPYPLMKAATLFVSSSRYEGFPNGIAEALSLGTPVVATNCPGGTAELVTHGRNGLLAPVGDHRAFGAMIKKGLLEATAWSREEIAAAAYRQVGAKRIVQAYEAVLGAYA